MELKRCPFCGGEAHIYVPLEGGVCVRCWKCGAQTKMRCDNISFKKPTNATQRVIDDWNNRVESEG